MKKLFLASQENTDDLFPFTLTRSAADIRIGILTIREKWKAYLETEVEIAGEETQPGADSVVISSGILPSRDLITSAFPGQQIVPNPDLAGAKTLQHPWDIFMLNDWAIREDYQLITAGRQSAPVTADVQVINPGNVFIEEGAKLSHCIINAQTGPVYIGKNSEIMEGTLIRGPFALCEGAVVKMGAKIYGATTIGPYSVVGGEIKNSVIFGYSNKSHDGYLGDSVIGEWCNLGAGTSNSNLKNTAGEIRMYSHKEKKLTATGLIKCGLIMGDYSRASINTSFNTGTIVGVCANVFCDGLTPKYIPSFSWGCDMNGKYEFYKAITDITKWKKLKLHELTETEKSRLKLIFDQI